MYFGEEDIVNPIDHFLSRKGSVDDGMFTLRDKEKEKALTYNLKDFIILKLGYAIGGYDQGSDRGLRSNEIQSLKNQVLDARFNDGEEIAKGSYASIKDTIKAKGGKLTRMITAFDIGENKLVRFGVHGNSFMYFENFLKSDPRVNRNTNIITFTGAEICEHLVGKKPMKYKEPRFAFGDAIGKDHLEIIQEPLGKMKSYDEYIKKNYGSTAISQQEENVEDISQGTEARFGETPAQQAGQAVADIGEAKKADNTSEFEDDLPF